MAELSQQPAMTLHVWDIRLPGAAFRVYKELRERTDKRTAKAFRRDPRWRKFQFITATVVTPDVDALWGFAIDEAFLLQMVRILIAHHDKAGRIYKLSVKPHVVAESTRADIFSMMEVG